MLHRPSGYHPRVLDHVNDGGRDGPMEPRDQRFFKHFFWIAAMIAAGLIVWMVVE